MRTAGRGLVPAGILGTTLVVLLAACAPPPAPAPAPAGPGSNALPACAPSSVAASAESAPTSSTPPATSSAVGAGSDGAEVVVVAVDEAGRPSIVSTDPDDAAAATADLESAPGVEVVAVEPDRVMTAGATGAATAVDPYRSQQWALDDLSAESLWATSTGSGVDVAVIDTGVLGSHPDFSGRICSGVAFLGSTGVEQPGQGSVDGNGHGTHVAGIAAAGRADGVGVAGVAPSARIMPVRVLDAAGSGSSSDVARGITWAVDHGAEVLNLSLGGPWSAAVASAVAYAEGHGVVVVAAAGNDGAGGPANHPAALADSLAVASYDEGGGVSWFSTRGAYVDVAAPGSGIVSAFKDGRWAYMSGTSMATPHVSGAVALLLAAEPGLSPAQVRARIESTAVDVGPIGHDDATGWGRLSALAALGG